MTRIKNENYFVVHGWMRNILNLRNRELDVFAIIYGFSQTEGNYFTASLDYLQEWCGLSKPAVITILNNLIKKHLILKYETNRGKGFIKNYLYTYNSEIVDALINSDMSTSKETLPENADFTGKETLPDELKNFTRQVKKLNSTSKETLLNNKYININNIDNKINNTRSAITPFDSTLSNKLKEDKITKGISKNKIINNTEKSAEAVAEIVSEKLSDIDNEEVKANKQRAIEKECNRAISTNKAIIENNKKARLKEARKRTTNDNLINALAKFLDSYQFSHNPMSPTAWSLILDELFTLSTNHDKLVEYVNHSTKSSYRKIVPNNVTKVNSFDNTANHIYDTKALHEFTKEELEEFDKKLARNSDGTYMTF